jgi:hypothetical protein
MPKRQRPTTGEAAARKKTTTSAPAQRREPVRIDHLPYNVLKEIADYVDLASIISFALTYKTLRTASSKMLLYNNGILKQKDDY